MPSTYTPIATQTLGSSATSVTFSSIASTYTDLVVVMAVLPTGSLGYAPWFQFNSDTGSNYSFNYLTGDGSSATAGRQTSQTKGFTGYTIGLSGSSNTIAHIQNYSNTTTNKTYIDRINETAGSFPGAGATVGLWRNTAAISTIKIGTDGTFNTGSVFTLYGIKAA
jgi:hypothetical protein